MSNAIDTVSLNLTSLSGTNETYVSHYWQTPSNINYTTYVTKEELEKTLEHAFAKQRLILERDKFKAAGLDPKALKLMLESSDEDSVKYALEVINNFME